MRAAAKNHSRVTIVVQPSDYPAIIASMPDGPDEKMRATFALKAATASTTIAATTTAAATPALSPLQAFSHTATYDTAIAEWMQSQLCSGRTGVHTLK